jgi:YVTN family beta-propeller protein
VAILKPHRIGVALAVLVVLVVIGGGCGNPATGIRSTTVPETAVPSAVATSPVATATGGRPSPTPTTPAANVVATIPIPGNPNGIIEGYGSVWVSSRHTDTVYRIDPATNLVTAKIAVRSEPSYFVDDGSNMWVVQYGDRAIARINPATNAIDQVTLPEDAMGVPAYGAGAVWQDTVAGVVKIDPASAKIIGTVRPPGPGGSSVAFGAGLLWVGQPDGTAIRRIDPSTLQGKDLVEAAAPLAGFALASDGSSVWSAGSRLMSRFDATTGKLDATFALPQGLDGGASVLAGGRLWLTRLYPLAFAHLDPGTGEVSPMQTLPNATTYQLWFLERTPHDLWIGDWDNNVVYRVDPPP